MSKWYAVSSGRNTGVYTSWKECEEQIKGFPKASYKSFSDYQSALNFALPPKQCTNPEYRIFTDGSCVNSVGGFAFLVLKKENSEWNVVDGHYGHLAKSTNNIAELTAIKNALLWVKNNCENSEVEIVSDSLYSINSILHFDGTCKANLNSIEEIHSTFKGMNIYLKHINSHQKSSIKDDIYYNNIVDELANTGRKSAGSAKVDISIY